MTALSRREFARMTLAGLPAAALLGPAGLAAAGRVVIGVSTTSFRDLPRVEGIDNLDDVIRTLGSVRTSHIELALANIEPAPPNVAPIMGGTPAYPRRIVMSPEQVAATNSSARATLRTWRLHTPVTGFEDVRRKLAAAGQTVHACSIAYNDSFTDDELDVTVRQIKALGVSTISSPLTMAMAARLVPVAERHHIGIAVHNQADGGAVGAITHRELKALLALSPVFSVKLDIGRVTASNGDPVRELATYQSRVSHVLVSDRLRNGGTSQPFGEGDTPIAAVLDALKASPRAIPAFVEYDYVGLRPMVDEVAASVQYLERRA